MIIEIAKEKYETPKKYIRNGIECFFDPARKKLIQATPEEIVRQRIIQFLIKEMEVPLSMIDTEVPVEKFKNGGKGRMDIVVLGKAEDNFIEPVLIVECKAETIGLTDAVFDQVFKYDEVVLADTVASTDGNIIMFSSWDYKEQTYKDLAKLPKYKDLLNKENIELTVIERIPWERPRFESLLDEKLIEDLANKRDY